MLYSKMYHIISKPTPIQTTTPLSTKTSQNCHPHTSRHIHPVHINRQHEPVYDTSISDGTFVKHQISRKWNQPALRVKIGVFDIPFILGQRGALSSNPTTLSIFQGGKEFCWLFDELFFVCWDPVKLFLKATILRSIKGISQNTVAPHFQETTSGFS